MFWIFRKRKPIKSAAWYLDVAASILQNRGKCEGKTHDDHGRVDAMGAMRLAIWGELEWDQVSQNWRLNGPAYWQKYDEVKILMHNFLHSHHPLYSKDRFCNRNYQTVHLQKWSDSNSPEAVVEWMKRASRYASFWMIKPVSAEPATKQDV